MTTNKQQTHEDRLFKRVKIGILVMLVVFSIEIFTFLPQYWPITRWRMFSASREMEPTTTSFQISVTDAQGQTYTLFPRDLGFAGANIIAKAFDDDSYQQVLTMRVQAALPDVDIITIEGLLNTYDVAYSELPPFDLMQPVESELLGTISFGESTGEAGQ